ncbi:MAG: DNA translocase FtsK, partial [Alistipes sp.]
MSKYSAYSPAQCEELLSGSLIDSWSYSKVVSFARNEKEFERTEVYGEKSLRSASSVAGNAYHKALELFFRNLSQGVNTPLLEMENAAYESIDEVPANLWKLQKTTPTIEECKISATKIATALLKNFTTEQDIYTTDIAEVLGVELRCKEWLTVNGVDIPLPCHAYIDLVVRLKDSRVVVVDHKSRMKFTDDKELAFVIGKQAITYAKCYEAKMGIAVDEVWFVENKYSKNTDGGAQLRKFKITLSADTCKLYESILYEPLRRMIEATSDPDYVYVINDGDNFADTAALYSFWAKTMIAEVDDFNIQESKKELISQRLKKIRDASLAAINPKTITEFRRNAASFITYDFDYKNMTNNEKIEHLLRAFGIIVKVAHKIDGYSSDTYLLEVAAGVKIANITKYQLDIANALNVSTIRIGKDLMVYEGRSYLFIEISKKRTKDLLFDPKYLVGEKLPIGVDNFGRTVVWDLNNHATPHVLVCGATGSGKSVSIISTVEYAKSAGIRDIVIFDPKYEFCNYRGKGVRVFNEIQDIEREMEKLVENMQRRTRNGERGKTLIVFDEFADAVASSRSGSDLDVRGPVQTGMYAN